MSRIDITQIDYGSVEVAGQTLKKLSEVYEENLTRINEIFDILISNDIFSTDSGSLAMNDAIKAGIREFNKYNENLLEYSSFLPNTAVDTNISMDEKVATIMNNAYSDLINATEI